MLICVQIYFKGSSRKVKQQVNEHEVQNLNKFSKVKARLKKSVFFKKEKLVQHIVSFPLIHNR